MEYFPQYQLTPLQRQLGAAENPIPHPSPRWSSWKWILQPPVILASFSVSFGSFSPLLLVNSWFGRNIQYLGRCCRIFPVSGTLVDPQEDLLLPPPCSAAIALLPGLGWAGSVCGSPLHRHSGPLYPSWQTKNGSAPDFSSFSIIYFFSFTFSHCSLPFSCTPFIPLPLSLLLSTCSPSPICAHSCHSPSFIFSSALSCSC